MFMALYTSYNIWKYISVWEASVILVGSNIYQIKSTRMVKFYNKITG
jgi:hypothetical protein